MDNHERVLTQVQSGLAANIKHECDVAKQLLCVTVDFYDLQLCTPLESENSHHEDKNTLNTCITVISS